MPWASVSDLKASDTYAKSASLRKMPEFRLRRFVDVFNRVHQKKTASGCAPEEADATAFAMAYASASRFQATPHGATLEAEKHYASTMAPLQFSMGGEVEDNSFDFMLANLDVVNAAVAGNAFNIGHDHTEPIGAIHRLIPRNALPPAIAAKVAGDTPFVTEFSYYQDTPEELKQVRTVSAEWLAVPRDDGRSEVMLPDSFAVTENPATDESLGVGIVAHLDGSDIIERLASAFTVTARKIQAAIPPLKVADPAKNAAALPEPEGEATAYLPSPASTLPGALHMPEGSPPASPPPKADGYEAKIASMSSELEAQKTAATQWASKYATLEGRHNDLQAKFAAMEATAQDRAARDAVNAAVTAGKIATEDIESWVADYKELGAAKFASLLSRVRPATLGVAQAKAAAVIPTDVNGDQARSLLAEIDPKHFGKSSKRGA